jgi:hypothetical protein
MPTRSSKSAAAVAAVFACAVAGAATSAHADGGTYGAATYLTERSCASVTAADACDGSGLNQQIVSAQVSGGVNMTSSATLTISDAMGHTLGSASGAVTFGSLELPVIKAATFSDPSSQVRMNSNDMGWQSYTYTGAAAPLSFTGALTIDSSTSNGVDGTLPNGAIFTEYVAIWDPSLLADAATTSTIDLFTSLYGNLCGTPGVLAAGYASGTLPSGGGASFNVTTTGCGGGPFVISPGQQVYVVAGEQLPVNRGGAIDASHTFRVELDPTLSAAAQQNFDQNLHAALPEPSAWALLVLGFGGLGAALRRRRGAVSVQA